MQPDHLLEGSEMVTSSSTFVLLLLLLALSLLEMVNSNPRSVRQLRSREENATSLSLPTSISFYDGLDEPPRDDCPRNQVKLANGLCYQLLTQGPCLRTHYVVLDPRTNRAYCGPRLCGPDRVFVFEDQLCYDPTDPKLCPEGLQLYQTSYGTPVCQCPDGTFEIDVDDQDAPSCESLLASSTSCPLGQVLWFRNFSTSRECVQDPCGGENLRKPTGDRHLLVPSAETGRCYSLGERGSCPQGTWYTLALDQLQGVCSSLEEAGYLVLDQEELSAFESFYGPSIEKDGGNDSQGLGKSITENQATTSKPDEPVIGLPGLILRTDTDNDFDEVKIPLIPVLRVKTSGETFVSSRQGLRSSYGGQYTPRTRIEIAKGDLLTKTSVRGSYPGVFSPRTSLDIGYPIAKEISRSNRSDAQFADAIMQLLIRESMQPRWRRRARGASPRRKDYGCGGRNRRRRKRGNLLPHFTPGTVFETRLAACKPGAKRDVNAKCRNTILPPRLPPKKSPLPPSSAPSSADDASRLSRAAPAVVPKPSCPPGKLYNIQRLCVNATEAIGSINAFNIG